MHIVSLALSSSDELLNLNDDGVLVRCKFAFIYNIFMEVFPFCVMLVVK